MMKVSPSDMPRITRRRFIRRTVSAVVLIVFFLLGYNGITANTQTCSAQYSTTPTIPGSALPPVLPSPCGCAGANTVPCTIPGSTALLTSAVESAYYSALAASASSVENYISMSVDTLVQTVFSRLEQTEQDLADWFDTYWYYNYKPSLQAMTEQANVAGMDQAQQVAAITDAEQQARAALEVEAADARSAIAQSDTAGAESCAVATSAGSLGNANAFSRAMRQAWQHDSNGLAFNRRGSPSARGPGAMAAVHAQEFENLFCNPSDNGGRNVCGASDPQFYNADIQVTGRIYNTLTIPVDKDVRNLTAVEHMVNNLMGRPNNSPLGGGAIAKAAGKQDWIDRRPYAARKNASRSVLNLVAGWRIPGGVNADGANCTGNAETSESTGAEDADTGAALDGTCSFVAALRQGAGVPLQDLSDNPSYREILHAMSIDRFNSGDYAIDKIGTAERQQMEKVVLNAIYLMQLRDYYELLERTALTLAVQVSVLSDEYPLATPNDGRRGTRRSNGAAGAGGGTP